MVMGVSQKMFQKWFKNQFGVDNTWFQKNKDGSYFYESVENAFLSWKAAEEFCLTTKKE